MPLMSIPSNTDNVVYDLDGARKAGVSDDDILKHLKDTYGSKLNYDFDGALKAGVKPSDIINHIINKINDPVGNVDLLKNKLINTKDNAIDLVKPVLDGLSTVFVGSRAGYPAGLASGAVTDAALQKLQSDKRQAKNRSTLADVTGMPKGSFVETAANSVQNEGLNELLGKLGNGILSKVKGAFNPVSTNPGLESLQPTFSQYGKPNLISSLIENIWNPGGKQAALENSAKIAREQASKIIGGSGDALADNIRQTGRMLTGDLNNRFLNGKDTINAVGKLNAQDIINTNNPAPPNSSHTILDIKPGLPKPTVTAKEVDRFGNKILLPQGMEPPTITSRGVNQTIEGPIYLQNTVDEATKFLNDRAKIYGTNGFGAASDSDKKLIQQAQTILEQTNNGSQPISFKDAMDMLHGPNGDGGLINESIKAPREINQVKDIQSNFANALHNDIRSSISKWNDPGKTALNAYDDANAAMGIKRTLNEGGDFKKLVETTNSPIPQVDAILKDPVKIQRVLNTSKINGVPFNNTKQDLAGYRLNQIWQGADNGVKGIDGSKLINQWNDPAFQATKDKLFSKQSQDSIGEFFNNVAKVSTPGQQGDYQKMRLTMRGVEIGATLLSGSIEHGLTMAGTFAAMEVPMMGLSRVLTNPARAAVLQKLITGAPLESSETQAGRLIMSGLNGTRVFLLNRDGQKTPAIVRDGKIVKE